MSTFADKEAQVATVPKNFRSSFTWCLRETFSIRISWLGPLSILILLLTLFSFPRFLNFPIICASVVAIVLSLVMPFFILAYKRRSVFSKEKEKIAQCINTVDPGVEVEKWDEVASKLNCLLYHDRSWNTPYFFYDGSICRHTFKCLILRPFLKDESNNEENEKNVLRETVERYQNRVESAFKDFQQGTLAEPSEEYKSLPRCNYYNRFTFHKGFFKSRFFVISLSQSRYELMLRRPFNFYSTFARAFFSAAITYFYFRTYCKLKYSKLDVKARVKFFATIVDVAPGEDLVKWDQVARHMNEYLRVEEKVWTANDDYFFDGGDCLSFFKEHAKPVTSGKLDALYPELQNIVSETITVCGSL